MWERAELKKRAKTVLRKIYAKAFLISVVIMLSIGWSNGNLNYKKNDNAIVLNLGYSINLTILKLFGILLVFIILFIVIAIALRVFVFASLEVGGRRYFAKSAQNLDNKGCFRYCFTKENYMGIVSTMLLKGVQNFLWYLLFIIPGTVKYYEYKMVPYILGENPNIGPKNAIALSRQMTNGHKMDMFVLDLSFIGWYLLGALALGIGIYFIRPYHDATDAELFLVLKNNVSIITE